MSDIAAVPPEAVIDPAIVAEPNPIEVDNVDHEAEVKQPEPKVDEPKKPSTRDALEKAKAKMDAEDKAVVDPKANAESDKKALEAKTAKERDETGKFKGKEPLDDAAKTASEAAKPTAAPKEPGKAGVVVPHDEPPARFSPEAKATWKDIPETHRAETHRAITELTKGIEEHTKRWEPIKQYDDLARQNGTSIDKALERYVAFDKLLNEDWEAGLESILKDKGMPPLKALAAHILGRKPEEVQQRTDQNTQRMQQQIEQLTDMVRSLGGHVQKTVLGDIDSKVATFAADKPWFDALQSEIAAHITAGLSLEEAAEKAHNEAQEKAKALGFIPQGVAEVAAPAAPAAVAQTDDKGKKSITGAPGAGAEPVTKKPSTDIREALRRARAQATD